MKKKKSCKTLDEVSTDIARFDNKVKGGRICLICHGFWPDTEALCPGCMKALA